MKKIEYAEHIGTSEEYEVEVCVTLEGHTYPHAPLRLAIDVYVDDAWVTTLDSGYVEADNYDQFTNELQNLIFAVRDAILLCEQYPGYVLDSLSDFIDDARTKELRTVWNNSYGQSVCVKGYIEVFPNE